MKAGSLFTRLEKCLGNCGVLKFEIRLLFLHRHLSRLKWNFGGNF